MQLLKEALNADIAQQKELQARAKQLKAAAEGEAASSADPDAAEDETSGKRKKRKKRDAGDEEEDLEDVDVMGDDDTLTQETAPDSAKRTPDGKVKEWDRFQYDALDDPSAAKAAPVLTRENRSKPNFTFKLKIIVGFLVPALSPV